MSSKITNNAASEKVKPSTATVEINEKIDEKQDLHTDAVDNKIGKESKVTVKPVSGDSTQNEPVVIQTASGWKIVLKNDDGTTQEVNLSPKKTGKPVDANQEEDGDGEETDAKPIPQPRQMRLWTIIQHVLTGTTSVVIMFIMVLTLLQFKNSQSVQGAWPQDPKLSSTYVMLAFAIIGLFADAINLCFQCCGGRTSANAKKIAGWVKMGCTGMQTILSAAGPGFFKYVNNTAAGRDLWGWSCTDAADAMSQVNNSGTLCTTNTAAFWLGILQIVLHVLNVALVIFAWWKPNGIKMTGTTEDAKELIKENGDVTGMVPTP